MKSPIQFFRFLGVISLVLLTQSGFASVESEAMAKLDAALTDLSNSREMISQERNQQAAELNQLEQTVFARRRELKEAELDRESNRQKIEALESQRDQLKNDYVSIVNLINRFNYGFEASLPVTETILFDAAFQKAAAARIDKTKGSPALVSDLIEASIQRLLTQAGGNRFSGFVIDQNGEQIEGTFAAIGPLQFFQSDDGKQQGAVYPDDSLLPHLTVLESRQQKQIATFLRDGRGEVPVDISNGGAIRKDAQKDSLFQHIQKGGFWIWPILLSALVAFALSIVKAVQLFGIRLPAKGVIHELLALNRTGQRDEALQVAEKLPQPASDLLQEALNHSDESPELVEELIYENLIGHQPVLERGLSAISLTAATAPLLGLLGTVTGMIHTFQLIELHGAGNSKLLSEGISEALITTEFGLIVAIPALIMHGLLSRRVHGILSSFEKISVVFVNGLRVPASRNKWKGENHHD